MSKENVLYSYDVDNYDSDDVVAKTIYRDNGRIDRHDHINESGYSHYGYKDGESYANGEYESWSRKYGENPDKKWDDRDGVMKK